MICSRSHPGRANRGWSPPTYPQSRKNALSDVALCHQWNQSCAFVDLVFRSRLICLHEPPNPSQDRSGDLGPALKIAIGFSVYNEVDLHKLQGARYIGFCVYGQSTTHPQGCLDTNLRSLGYRSWIISSPLLGKTKTLVLTSRGSDTEMIL